VAEAEAKVHSVEAQRAEAEAKAVAAQATYDRMKAASATPGVIAANELTLAEKAVDAAKALVRSLEVAAQASRGSVLPLKDMQAYLEIRSPFDGIVTERNVHPGALAGPGATNPPLLAIEQQSRLRLIVAVPEMDAASVARGAQVSFRVPAYPGQAFSGTVARLTNSMDPKTRTMPVELDVANPKSVLAPGMYPEVEWPVRRSKPSLVVPATAIATTTERSFVIRVAGGRAEWVNVSKGVASGDLFEVLGALSPGDVIVKRASDEIRDGSTLQVKK
jgi:RND family efflux transporter MFP subunit